MTPKIRIICEDGMTAKVLTIDGEPVPHVTAIVLQHEAQGVPMLRICQLGGPDGADSMERSFSTFGYTLEIEVHEPVMSTCDLTAKDVDCWPPDHDQTASEESPR